MALGPAHLLAASTSDAEMLGRIGVAALAGLIVGWERGIRNRAAGPRTFGLMAAGAAVFTAAGLASGDAQSAGRVIQGVATGVGFIGAGLVWRGSQSDIHGLTTAAAMWAMVAVGTLSGLGRPILALGVSCLVVFMLELPYIPGFRRLDPRELTHAFKQELQPDDLPQPRRWNRTGDD